MSLLSVKKLLLWKSDEKIQENDDEPFLAECVSSWGGKPKENDNEVSDCYKKVIYQFLPPPLFHDDDDDDEDDDEDD